MSLAVPSRSVILRTSLRIIPLSLSAIGLVAIFWGTIELAVGQNPALIEQVPVANTAKSKDSTIPEQQIAQFSSQLEELKKSRQELSDRLDSIDKQASREQWVLSIILAAAGILTFAQGLVAYFNAKNYVDQADDAIKRANVGVKQVDALENEVRAKYPMFNDVESARSNAFDNLGKLTSVLVRDYENLYANSEPLTRQEIFAIESFSAMQFLTGANRGKDLVRNLQLLGRFYGGKVLFDGSSALQSDFERALYYLELAAQKSNRTFSVLNDLGWLHVRVANPKQPEKGRSFFKASLLSNPDQQRALYNLGTLAWDKSDKTRLQEGIDYLLKAKLQRAWEETPHLAMAAHIDYNLACFYDALSIIETEPAKKSKLLDQCASNLTLAAKLGSQTKELLEEDLTTGDLMALAASEAHTQRLQHIRALYEVAWQR